MRIKDKKYRLTIYKDEIDRYITYVMAGRNAFIADGRPVDHVNALLLKLMKIKRKLGA